MKKIWHRVEDYLDDLQWRPWFWPALLAIWILSWGSIFVMYPDPFLLTGPQLAQKMKGEQAKQLPR